MVPPENSVDQKLNDIISSMNKVLVGYSGGVDSTFLLHFCIQILGTENVTAVVIDHPLMRDGSTCPIDLHRSSSNGPYFQQQS